MRLPPPSAFTPQHWSKDFVEHLRTVHFTLVTVSIGLILILTSTSYDARRAFSEFNAVVEMRKWLIENFSVSEPPQVVESLTPRKNRLLSFDVVCCNATYFEARPDPSAVSADSTLRGRSFLFHIVEPNSFECKGWYSHFDLKNPPNSVRQFASWWDGRLPVAFDRVNGIANSGSLSRMIRDETGTRTEQLPGTVKITADVDKNSAGEAFVSKAIKLDLGNGNCGYPTKLYDTPAALAGDDGKYFFVFKVNTIRSTILDQNSLHNQFADLRPGGFSSSFRDLAKAAEGRDDLPLDALAPVLRDEASKLGEAFEAFGVKFQGEQITRWGMVVLIGVQLYLLMYLIRLSKHLRVDDPGWDVPWMAMDESRLARAMLFFSVVLLPAAAASLLVIQTVRQVVVEWTWHTVAATAWQDAMEIVLMFLGFVFCLALSILSWKYRPQLDQSARQLSLFSNDASDTNG